MCPHVIPLVTIVIPCFNYGRFLSQALTSVEQQRYRRLEIIVVDDGSTDETARIARRPAVRVVRQRRRGLNAARNAGLEAAQGEYVVFLDADDELLPDAIASGSEALSGNTALACVVRRCQVIDAEGRDLPARYPDVRLDDLYREWLQCNFVWTPGAAIFRRQRIAAIGGFPLSLGSAADYAVYLRLAREGAVAFDDRAAVRYRQHDCNMSRDPVLMLESTLAVLAAERQHVKARAHREAWAAGMRACRSFYGEQIVEGLRRSLRAGGDRGWRLRASYVLARQCTRVFLLHTVKKLSRVARGLPPAQIEPGRFDRE